MPVNPYQKYKQQSIMTMTPGELLLKLYDESINQLRQAVGALGQKQYDKANAALQKAQRIISHLNKTLVMIMKFPRTWRRCMISSFTRLHRPISTRTPRR